MLTRLLRVGAVMASLAPLAVAQVQDGDMPRQDGAARLLFKTAQFDPAAGTPVLPGLLRGDASTNLWIVQFVGRPEESWRDAVRALGAEIYHYVPDNAHVVRMPGGIAAGVQALPNVRWVGPYEPAFRLEAELLFGLTKGLVLPKQKYNIVVVDKHLDKPALETSIRALGGIVEDEHDDSILLTVTLDAVQLMAAARLDQVLWIDRWTPREEDMNNARIQGGGNYVGSVGGYTGSGIRGHVYEGVEFDHPDFTIPFTLVGAAACSGAARHGHATAGIVFGNGTSHANARGMAPDARGYYTNYQNTAHVCATSRNATIAAVVNTHQCMFTTASWGNTRTTLYTSISADSDDVVFDHRIPWTQSQSNAGTQASRPQAWAKNVFSIGAVQHFDNSNAADDSWAAGNASIGPASDGRIKPDLCAYYDAIWTSDLTVGGYSTFNYTTSFGGTSGATPIVAGHNALAIQMYTDGIFGNAPRVPGGTRFQNRPYAPTLKALMIACAEQYPFTSASTDNRREHQGWGFPNLRTMYDNRNRIFLVSEDDVLVQGETATYTIDVQAGEPELKICMTYLEPMGNPAVTNAIVNDLTLKVTSPGGTVYWGNNGLTSGTFSTSGGVANRIDSVECVFVNGPTTGAWTVEVTATQINVDAHVATPGADATYALCVNGGRRVVVSACADYSAGPAPDSGTCNVIPFGGQFARSLTTLFASNNSGAPGGAVYFDLTVNRSIRLDQFAVNTNVAAGSAIGMNIYLTSNGGTSVGNQTNPAAWSLVASGIGTSTGLDEPSHVSLRQPIVLLPGTYGVALVSSGFGHQYTNGTGSNQNYSDSNIALALGTATNVPFAGGVFSPRVANIQVNYSTITSRSLQTLFLTNNSGSPGGAVYFDLTVSTPLTLSQVDVNTNATVGTAIGLDLYLTAQGTSSVGNETNPAAWTKVSSGTGTSAGVDTPSACALDTAVTLAAGTYGVAIVSSGFGHRYTNGTGSNQNYNDANIALALGAATNVPFAGSAFSPRVANIALHYLVLSQTYVNQRYQMLVRSADITHTGQITGLAFAACGTGVHHCDSLEITMSHVPPGWTLSSTFSNNLPNPVRVVAVTSNHWPITANSWNEVGLQRRFNYNGVSDLVIEVITRGNRAEVSVGGFHRDSNTPRIYNTGWTTLPSTASSSDNRGQKVRLEFGCANASIFGQGCGDLELRTSGLPVIRAPYGFDAYRGVPTAGIWLNLGLSNGTPFPLDMTPFGYTGCTFWHDIFATIGTVTNASGAASVSYTVPNNPRLIGFILYGQFIQLNRAAPGGATFSNYARIMHGVQP